jgi:ABC-type lipoprotein release transport system permease subunit
MAPTIRAIGTDAAPNVPITTLQTAEETKREAGLEYRILARAMSAAGVLALLLATFGLFSLLTYLVAQRRRELGIRLALGATRENIVRLVVGESAVVAIAGAVLGGIAAAGIALTMRSMFVGVGPADPMSYAAAAGVLVFAALAASAHPAVRASRTDPASVLRTE